MSLSSSSTLIQGLSLAEAPSEGARARGLPGILGQGAYILVPSSLPRATLSPRSWAFRCPTWHCSRLWGTNSLSRHPGPCPLLKLRPVTPRPLKWKP